MTREEISEKFLGFGEIHAIGQKEDGTIAVYYRMLKGNSMGAWDQSSILQELIADAAPTKVELIDSPPARLIWIWQIWDRVYPNS